MYALSFKQPYASLMLHGKIETRTWPTNYRGLVLICASKSAYNVRQILNISGLTQYQRIHKMFRDMHDLPMGVAIAVADLVDCRPMEESDGARCFVEYASPWTESVPVWGEPGKIKPRKKRLWCHVYDNVRAIEPMPWKGSQGFSTVPQEFINQIIYL